MPCHWRREEAENDCKHGRLHRNPHFPAAFCTLSGTGTNAVIGVTDIAFGTVVQGGAGSSMNIVVSNNGAATKGNLGVTSAMFMNNAAGWLRVNQA